MFRKFVHRAVNILKGGFLMDVLFWAIAFVIFVIAEFATIQLVSIWFALGSLVSLLMAYFTDFTMLSQLTVFIIISALSLCISLPMLRRRKNKPIVRTNCELEVGKVATVIEDINFDRGTGRVTLNGVDWSASASDPAAVIPKGSVVTVTEIKGTKLTVVIKESAPLPSN